MGRPLAVPLLAFILGLALAGNYGYFFPPVLLVSLLAATLLSVFLRCRQPFWILLSLSLFVSGDLLLEQTVNPDLPPGHIARCQSEEPVIVEGVIDSRPEATERGGRLTIRCEEVYREKRRSRVTGRLLLAIGEGRAPWMTGDRVRFSSRIRRPRNYGLPGEFDFELYLACKGIFATAFIKSPDEMILIREGVAYRLQRAVDLVADRIGAFIDARVPRAEGSILRALIIGDMGYVDRATKDAYSRTGVNHILSISGFHVGVIAVFIFQILLYAAKTSRFLLLHLNLRRLILLFTLPLIMFYLFLSGAAPATTRSVIMIAVYILALVMERETDPIHSLILAALLILALTPAALFDISFQLSFLALWGIVVLTPLFTAPFALRPDTFPARMLLFLMASAAATVATLVTVAYHFHRVSATGLISNFFIVPLMGYGAVVLGFSALPFIAAAPPVAGYLLYAAAFLVKISNMIIAQLDRIPTLPLINPTRLDLLVWYLFLLGLTFIGTRKGKLACCGMLVLCVSGEAALAPHPEAGKLSIVFFSLGQCESTLVTFPDGKRMLVDGGGNAREGAQDVGERLLAPALWKLGVTRIDYLVLSHPHPDHVQG
ncbi:MAG TPA: ComEC/Rec2 family competence protein, partial [Geobacteraceae bacterium]|nr:ComEC/Rec2 family competence protein [Geobacteraceae bacterium]